MPTLDIVCEELRIAGDVEDDPVEVVEEVDGTRTVVLDDDLAVGRAGRGMVAEVEVAVDC